MVIYDITSRKWTYTPRVSTACDVTAGLFLLVHEEQELPGASLFFPRRPQKGKPAALPERRGKILTELWQNIDGKKQNNKTTSNIWIFPFYTPDLTPDFL